MRAQGPCHAGNPGNQRISRCAPVGV